MALLRPVGDTINAQGTLSSIVPRAVIEEVNNELKGTCPTPKRRSSYSSFSSEQKAQVAKYASTNRVRPEMVRIVTVPFLRIKREQMDYISDYISDYIFLGTWPTVVLSAPPRMGRNDFCSRAGKVELLQQLHSTRLYVW